MISIIHPSRSRPERSYKTCVDWATKAHCDYEIIVSLDEDDPQLNKYFNIGTRIVNKNRSAVEAINRGAEMASGDILIVVSDDTECFYGWGKELIKYIAGREDIIIKTQDGIQDWVITMPIMDRKYYQRFGYIYFPGYIHAWCDTELTCVAELTGRKKLCNFNFPHRHHSVAGGVKDEVSERADSSFEEGRNLFTERLAIKFDLKDPPGFLTPNNYTQLK